MSFSDSRESASRNICERDELRRHRHEAARSEGVINTDGFNGLKRLKDTARRIIPECDHEAMNLLNVDAQAMGVMMNE